MSNGLAAGARGVDIGGKVGREDAECGGREALGGDVDMGAGKGGGRGEEKGEGEGLDDGEW